MAEVCEGYSYGLAAFDVLPIVFFAIGFVFLARYIRAVEPSLRHAVHAAAVALVVGASLAGPIRKALIAADPMDCDRLDWMQLPFFTLMSAAFAALAWAMLTIVRRRDVAWWPFLVAVALCYVSAAIAGTTMVLLAAGGIFAVMFAIEAAIVAKRHGDITAVVLFVLYAVGTLGLPVLASSEDRADVSHQWLEQGVNTFNMIVFAVACYRLLRATQRVGNRSVLVES
jgi:hypothetical protein